MTGFHDDILKLIAKRIRLQSNHQLPIIHLKINLDKCYQLFEHQALVPKPSMSVAGNTVGLLSFGSPVLHPFSLYAKSQPT